MRFFLISFILLLAMTAQGISVQSTLPKAPPGDAVNLVGRWRVKFTLMGGNEKNLVFEARGKGEGSFLLLDTGLDDKPVVAPQAAVWSLTNNNASISGEVELPIGTCCREMGTLIFKARINSGNSLSGKFIFVSSIEEEESPNKFRTTIGTFTATRMPAK